VGTGETSELTARALADSGVHAGCVASRRRDRALMLARRYGGSSASFDELPEALIQAGLAFLMKGRTTFVIAHRLSTIRRADQILVVEAGRIVERGTHESLYAARGRYFDLYTKQHGVETNLFLAPGEGDEAGTGETQAAPAAQAADGATLSDAVRLRRR